MRKHVFKFFPIVYGLLLGWLLFHPPAWLQSLGVLAWVINAAVCGLLLLSVVPVIALANLPSELKIEWAREESVHHELRVIGERFSRLGFRPIGPPMRVHVAPPAIMLGYVHETEPVYATAYRTDTLPAKTGFDFVSVLYGDRGGLTTNADPAGASLPAGPGVFRQVFPGQGVEALFKAHGEGIEYLRARGIQVRPVSADMFQHDLRTAMRSQREQFLSMPVRSSLITFWRSATKQVPFVGRLRDQKVAGDQITRFLSGQHQGAF